MILLLQIDWQGERALKQKQVTGEVKEIYKQCFLEYFQNLHRYAFTIVKDNAEAKDIVQSAFQRLWEKREDIDMETSARAYLYTTVYRLSLIRLLENTSLHLGGNSSMAF